MNVKFVKTVSVDFEDCRTTEIYDKTFPRGKVVRDVGIEKLSKNFVNLHFVNGDLAINVPSNSFEDAE